ncbi:tetratricopeptide repeat protein [Breznakiella homolactica]|uniref:Tetratricopeptide repeat protein n=1 Tax=Breznakiella homolactica TaxID=2798577 RepID=A0A7T8BAF5_9SPIR|nr:tetratricopeptide repeat protein [Breznakiella homolactica]QQO08163.1 tetratricopeptide repeat protein [Breznakiella homolactica]
MANPSSGKNEPTKITEKLVNFIQNHRKIILIVSAAVVVVFVGIAAAYIISEKAQEKAIAEVEAYYEQYESLRVDLNEPFKEDEVRQFIASLSEFAGKKSGYAGARAYYIIADIHADKKEWLEAEHAWVNAAGKAPRIYLAPVSFFNAAVAAEEQGNSIKAIELYTRALEYADTFPGAPRAAFSVGRLYEEQRDTEAAVAAYRNVIEQWPGQNWANLASSRVAAITASGGV